MDRSTYQNENGLGRFSESSVNDPGFWKKKISGSPLSTNPYEWWREDASDLLRPVLDGSQLANTRWYTSGDTTGSVGFTMRDALSAGYFYTSRDGVGLFPPIAVIEGISSWKNEIGNKILSKVRNREVDLGVALGEHRETAEFISSAMVKTAKSYVQLRHGDVSGALRTITGRRNNSWRDIPGAAANTWLAYCYGLRPLLKDVHDAASVYENRYKQRPSVFKCSASISKDFDAVANPNRYYIMQQIRGSASIRASVEMFVTNPVLKTLDQCGVTNPLSIAWELVPFSFVVDWFIPVGAFISNIIPPQGVDFVNGWISVHCSGSSVITVYKPATGGSDILGIHTQYESKEVWKKRERISTLPSYHLNVPDLSLSRAQIASGIALLAQALIK